ncbi:MAG: carboxypeptidase-like regulatory domain-containing protein [Acidobacteria bacterium]|nr:carboxypeptidase-like regulatory domain-containing protein [Acidobacteriota bacterium]
MKSTLVRICCLVLLLATAMVAQEFRATISGEVTDPAGAAVEGAKIVATNVARNVPYEATANTSGRYIIQFLLPGKYTVTIEKPGFKKFVREGVVLVGADKLALDAKLDLGAVVDSVTVTGDVSLLQTETATRQTSFENRLVENVPSGGRNIFALMYDQPGVVKNSTYWGSMELYAFGNVNGVSISGGRPSENETILDGSTCSLHQLHPGIHRADQLLRCAVRARGRRRDDDQHQVRHQRAARTALRILQEREIPRQ